MLKALYGVLLPFLVSLLLAYILDPIVGFFQNKCHIRNRALAVIVTLLVIIGLISAAISIIVPEAKTQYHVAEKAFAQYISDFNIDNYVSQETQAKFFKYKGDWNLQEFLAREDINQGIKEFGPKVLNWLSGGLSALGSLLMVFLGLMYLIFLMIDLPRIRETWSNYVPKKFRPQAISIVDKVDENMSAYFRGQVMIASCVGVLFAIGFSIIGLPMSIIMGLVIGVLNLVPYMQALGIPPCIVLAILQSMTTDRPLWLCLVLVAVVFVVVQGIQDMVLTPKIMGHAMGLSPAIILLSLSVWGAILGIIGMILALPITTLILYYYDRYVANRGVTSRAHQDVYQGRLRKVKEEK